MKYVKTSFNTGYVRNDGFVRIYHFVNLYKKRVKLAGNVYIESLFWDESSGKAKGKSKKARDYNLLLEKERATLNEILIRYRLSGRELTIEQLKKEFSNPDVYTDFKSWLKYNINSRKDITDSTSQIHLTVYNELNKFRKSILFADITPGFLRLFDSWMKKQGNRVNTRNKKMRALKSYLAIAVQEEMIERNPFADYKLERGPGRLIYLTKDEVQEVRRKYDAGHFNTAQTIAARNWLASFYLCGMPRADFVRFRMEWIHNNDTVIYTRHKTRRKERVIKIPLSMQAKELLDKHNKNRVAGAAFQTFRDQTENRLLKEVATLSNIDKPLTFHVARHTFATLFYEETGDIATLQQLMGHKNISETMVYAHVSETKKRELMRRFESGL